MTYSRVKRIHFSPGGRAAIVCGVYARGGRRVRFTKHRGDITCDHCQRVLDARERKTVSEADRHERMLADGEYDQDHDPDNGEKAFDPAMLEEAKKLAASFYRKRFEELFRHLGFDKAECRACKRTVWWVLHKNGKRVPYTVDGQNHFSNCPQRDAFRRKR